MEFEGGMLNTGRSARAQGRERSNVNVCKEFLACPKGQKSSHRKTASSSSWLVFEHVEVPVRNLSLNDKNQSAWRPFMATCFGMLMLCGPTVQAQAVIATPNLLGTVSLQSWKTRHDAGIVRQQHDFSCGAASLATVMGMYGHEVSEAEVMKAMNKERGEASFEDMAEALPAFGFQALGVAISFEQLTTLQEPVIAFVRNGRRDHFTVIRGVSGTHVWLGDPAWGNRVVTRDRFLAMWETRDDSVLKGKVLVIQPEKQLTLKTDAFGQPKPSIWLGMVILARP